MRPIPHPPVEGILSMSATDVTTDTTVITGSTVNDDPTGDTGAKSGAPKELIVQGRELHRGLHLVENIARGAAKDMPLLRCVRIVGTSEGIMVEATDRYIVARSVISTSADASGLGEHLVEVETVKQVLRLAKESKTNPITITWPTEENPMMEFDANGHQYRAPLSQEDVSRYPRLSRLLSQQEQHDKSSGGSFGVAPAFLAKLGTLKTLLKGKEAVVLSPSVDPTKPIRFTAGDWLVGLVMPVKLPEEALHASQRAGALGTL